MVHCQRGFKKRNLPHRCLFVSFLWSSLVWRAVTCGGTLRKAVYVELLNAFFVEHIIDRRLLENRVWPY